MVQLTFIVMIVFAFLIFVIEAVLYRIGSKSDQAFFTESGYWAVLVIKVDSPIQQSLLIN